MRFIEKIEVKWDERGFKRWYKRASPETQERVNEVMAEARFIRAETMFKEAMEVQLYDPERGYSESFLQRSLEKKAKIMGKAVPIYMEVLVKYKSANWGLAALCRVGMMFHDLASQLQDSPPPPRLTEDQALMYEEYLFEYALGFEDNAVKHYVIALEKAAELGWFNEFTNLARKRLYELRPQEYRSASEIMVQPNNIPVEWHQAELYTDVEVAAGRKKAKRRKKRTLSDDELKKTDEAAQENPDSAAATPN